MHRKRRQAKRLAAAWMALFLLSGCGTQTSAPKQESPDKQPSTFYYYDAGGQARVLWQTGTDAAQTATAAQRLYLDAATDALMPALMKARNCTENEAELLLLEGGLQIYTCMNPTLQALADTACAEQSKTAAVSESGLPMQAALVLLDNPTGRVLALSGGTEQSDANSPNPATQMLRQPGSALLPLSIYAPALELGKLTPDSVERDRPDENGWPENPSGTYQDEMSLRDALRTSSYCVPVEVMKDALSPELSAQFLQERFSLDLVIDRSENGTTYTDVSPAALALGGLTDGVSPMDMAAAFSVFPRGGQWIEPVFFTQVLDSAGVPLLVGESSPQPALKERTASDMTSMLHEVVLGGVGAETNLEGQTVAGMPGTSPAQRDVWFVGYTPQYTAAVWSGYASKETISAPGNPAAQLWKQVMQAAHGGQS